MSEFEYVNGHLLHSGVHVCPICKGRLYRMDGMSARELKAMEREEQESEEEEEE